MRSIRATLSFVCMFGSTVYAQDDCRKEIHQLLSDTQKDIPGSPRGAFRTKMQIITIPRDKSEPASTEVIVVTAGDGRSIMENQFFKILEDKENRVIMMPKDSIVYIYDQIDMVETVMFDLWEKKMKLVLDKGEVTSCNTVIANGVERFEVTLSYPPGSEASMLKQLKIVMDRTRRKPISIQADYHAGSNIRRQTITYLTYDLGFYDPRLTQRAVDLVLDQNGSLIGHVGFTLRDLRAKGTDVVNP